MFDIFIKMSKLRRHYKIKVVINGITFNEVIIDPHFEKNHSESINDEIILDLIKWLGESGTTYETVGEKGHYSFFVTDGIKLRDKYYKLIWMTEEDQLYIGVVNAYRRSK